VWGSSGLGGTYQGKPFFCLEERRRCRKGGFHLARGSKGEIEPAGVALPHGKGKKTAGAFGGGRQGKAGRGDIFNSRKKRKRGERHLIMDTSQKKEKGL